MDGDFDKTTETGVKKSDDYVLPFQLENSGARGRLIRLGSVAGDILTKHDYPEPVLLLLGEAVTLAAMLGAALKFEGKFILQTQSDGPVSFLVVHFSSPGHLRGYVSYNKEDLARIAAEPGSREALLGKGHLAMTIDPGAGMERYQGIVALTGAMLVDSAHEYFDRSEQIPTYIKIAVARHYSAGSGSKPGRWTWRAGGLMVQKLTGEGGRPQGDEVLPPTSDEDPESDEGWRRTKALAATVEDHELLDPTLTGERLLYRLFHEESVRVFDASPLDAECTCSRDKVEHMLSRFSKEDIAEMSDGEAITVTCEFCNTDYSFNAGDYPKEEDAGPDLLQ